MFHYHYLIFACMLTYFVRCFFSYLVFHVCFFSLSPEVYSEKCTCWNWYKMLISLKKGQRYFDKNLSIFSFSEWISGIYFANAKWKPNCEFFFNPFQTLSPVKQPLFKMKPLMHPSVMSQAQTLSTFSLVLASHGPWLPSIGNLKAWISKWNLEGKIFDHWLTFG